MQEASNKHFSEQLIVDSEQGNGAKLGGGGDGGDLGKEADRSTAKGEGEKSLREHGIEGSEEGRANQRKSGAIELVREAIKARGLVWGCLLDGGGELRHRKGVSRLSRWAGERQGRPSKKRGKVAGSGEKGVPESTGSEASAAAAWRPWKMAE
jgi:hypothetical protein